MCRAFVRSVGRWEKSVSDQKKEQWTENELTVSRRCRVETGESFSVARHHFLTLAERLSLSRDSPSF